MITSDFIKLYPEPQLINRQSYVLMDIPVDSIKFDKRLYTWSAIDFMSGYNQHGSIKHIALFALFENDVYGDCTDYILAFFDWYSGDNNWKEIAGTYDDILTALYDEGCIVS